MVSRPNLSPETDLQFPSQMWVVFSDDTDIRLLKLLRHGFRHCFVIMQQDERWVLIDPRANKTDIQLLPHPAHFNFPRYFTQAGKTVMKVSAMNTPQDIAPLFPWSCVETVKRVLGLHKRWILTPYQLFKYLKKGQ